MKYRIAFSDSAARQWRKLPQDICRRIAPHIDRLSDTPRPIGSKKMTDGDEAYRIRIGEYRVIYRVEDDVLVVLVIRSPSRRSLPICFQVTGSEDIEDGHGTHGAFRGNPPSGCPGA